MNFEDLEWSVPHESSLATSASQTILILAVAVWCCATLRPTEFQQQSLHKFAYVKVDRIVMNSAHPNRTILFLFGLALMSHVLLSLFTVNSRVISHCWTRSGLFPCILQQWLWRNGANREWGTWCHSFFLCNIHCWNMLRIPPDAKLWSSQLRWYLCNFIDFGNLCLKART